MWPEKVMINEVLIAPMRVGGTDVSPGVRRWPRLCSSWSAAMPVEHACENSLAHQMAGAPYSGRRSVPPDLSGSTCPSESTHTQHHLAAELHKCDRGAG
jgi:hypothetical protein